MIVCALGFKYYGDATSGDAATVGASAGYGIYVMIAGGIAGIAGGIMRLMAKKNVAAA